MSKKILVIGSNGLLGSTLVKLLTQKQFDVITSDISDGNKVDITNRDSILSKIQETNPDFIVNCAAYTNTEACEDKYTYPLALSVNADGPQNLVQLCAKYDIGLVHISTDYVFGENKISGYLENHTPYSPLNKYGETKVKGEQAIIKTMGGLKSSDFIKQDPLVYIVRTSSLFGEGATNFIAKIIHYAKEREFLEVVTDEVVCPTYVKDLSEGIIYLLEQKPKGGIYHYSGEGSCTRKEFAEEILKLSGINTPVKPTTLDKFDRKAKVPNISILKNSKFPDIRNWKEMLSDFLTT